MGFTITAAELIAFLASQGLHRETGSGKHGVNMVKGSFRIPIPMHKGDMPKGTATHVLLQSGFTADDVIKWRNK